MRVVTRVIRQGDAEGEVCTASLAAPGPPAISDTDFAEWDRAMRVLSHLPPAKPVQAKAPRE